MKMEHNAREKIISAAYQILAEKGYDAATTKGIAQQAGVAQGLINYYFPSKDDLFLAVLEAESTQFCSATQTILDHPGPLSPDEVAGIIKNKLQQTLPLYRLTIELYALGLRNEKLHQAVCDHLNSARSLIQQILGLLCDKPAHELAPLAAIFLAAVEGLAVQKLADPEFDFDRAFDELIRLMTSRIASL